MIWETILASMLSLQPPGASIYSQVEVSKDAPAPCDDKTSLMCRKPRYDAKRKAWTVAETYEQGIGRYEVIAREIARARSKTVPDHALHRYLMSIFFHESGYRRDVHDGSTRGDCTKGYCHSWCLGQILLYRGDEKLGRSLVGIDAAATGRCVAKTVKYIEHAHTKCRADIPYCIFKVYGGVKSQNSKKIRARVWTYRKLSAKQ